jgi:hypothetical protein
MTASLLLQLRDLFPPLHSQTANQQSKANSSIPNYELAEEFANSATLQLSKAFRQYQNVVYSTFLSFQVKPGLSGRSFN